MIKNLIEQCREDFRSDRVGRWTARLKADLRSRCFAGLLLICLAGISALLRADYLYQDDMGRAMSGMRGWSSAGRPLADFLASLLYLSGRTFDASPLTQLTAIFMEATASLLLLKAVRIRLSPLSVLCVTPVCLSPYILENLSFKFDSPSMAAALIFAVLPPALTTCLKNRGTVILVSSVCLYCACALYHAALGAYLCTAAYLLISELSSRKPINAVLRHAYALALPFVIGTGTFAAVSFFQNRFDSFHSHTAGALAMPSLSDMPAVIAGNSKHYYEILFNDWSASCFGWLFAACFALFVARTLLRWNSNRIRDGQRTTSPCAFRPFPRLAALLLLMFFLPLSIFGLQVCMQTPLWWPRYFQSFGFLPALCLLGVGRTGIRPAFARSVPEGSAGGAPVRPCPATKALYGKAVTALAGLVAAQLVLFADVYGNLSARQKEWEFLHISSLYFDLRKLIQDGQGKVIVYRGSIGHTPLLRVPASKFPVLFRLVHVYASDELNGYWSGKQMRVYGIAADRADSAPAASSLSLRTVNPAYTIETGPDGTAVVTFFPADKTPVPPEMPRPVPDRR